MKHFASPLSSCIDYKVYSTILELSLVRTGCGQDIIKGVKGYYLKGKMKEKGKGKGAEKKKPLYGLGLRGGL